MAPRAPCDTCDTLGHARHDVRRLGLNRPQVVKVLQATLIPVLIASHGRPPTPSRPHYQRRLKLSSYLRPCTPAITPAIPGLLPIRYFAWPPPATSSYNPALAFPPLSSLALPLPFSLYRLFYSPIITWPSHLHIFIHLCPSPLANVH